MGLSADALESNSDVLAGYHCRLNFDPRSSGARAVRTVEEQQDQRVIQRRLKYRRDVRRLLERGQEPDHGVIKFTQRLAK